MKRDKKNLGIDDEKARKILDADLKNIVSKVASGKTLTARERKIIEESTSEKLNADSVNELIALLGIARSHFYRIKKKDDAPKGLIISEWKDYLIKIEVGGVKEITSEEMIQLKAKLLKERAGREEIERKLKQLKLEREEKGYVPMEEAKQAITRVLEPIARLFSSIPKKYSLRMNPSDPDHAEQMLREMVEEVKRQIQSERGIKITKRKGTK